MAKGGGKKRSYVRDGNGRFASTPGGGKSAALKGGTLGKRSSLKGSKARLAAKDKADPSIRNTLSTRAQKGAVTRGNKVLRAAKAASQRTAVGRSKVGTVAKGKKPSVLKATALKPQAARVPASQRPGSMTSTLRATTAALAKADARRIREVESITGQKVKPTAAGAKAGKEAGARVRATAKGGKVADTLRAGLRELAQSDARTMRGMAGIVRDATPKVAGGKGGKALKGAKKGSSSEEPVTVQKATVGKTYKIPPRPTATTAVRSSSDQPSKPKTQAKTQADSGKRVEKRIASIMDRRINRSASPEKQFKALQTQKRAAEYLRAASKFAERKNVSLSKALQSGPKNSTKPKKSPRRQPSTAPAPKPKPPTRTKGSKATLPRTPGTVAKPKGLKPGIKMSKGRARPGQAERAIARALKNQLNSEDPRNKNPNARIYSERGNRPGKKQMRSMLRADSALDFYRDPAKALRTSGTNRTKPGYRVPRELSLNFDVWPKRRRKRQP